MDCRYIKTVDFGTVPVRQHHCYGNHLADIDLTEGGFAEIRSDVQTNQPFAVLFDKEWNQIGKDFE